MAENKSCEGGCEKHVGPVREVIIWNWSGTWHYCQEAIEEDRRRGLLVYLADDELRVIEEGRG